MLFFSGWRPGAGLMSLLALASTALLTLTSPVSAQAVPPVFTDTGDAAFAFDMSQVSLSSGRFLANQNRTLSYIKWVDVERLLYVFRATHGLSTKGAAKNGGWDAPDFPFRSHAQGHFLNAWAYCYAVLQDNDCRSKATYFAAELAKCQANNGAVGFTAGYLSGFPESEFDKLESRTLSNGNVPYYAVHKTMAGLLDVWRHIGDTTARDVLLRMAAWVDTRTSRLSYAQMQNMMGTEFGGMNEVMADIFHQTGDKRWLTVAKRFDHAAIFDALAAGRDELNGKHANTQVPKWIGAAREFKASKETRYRDIARNAWDITVKAHSYAIGGNSQAEHFRPPNEIASRLSQDTAEACNTYNMLKLTRELWMNNPARTDYFDFYERALLNHLLGQQNPSDGHGHVTYFTPLNPGGRRGVGPAWGGGTYSTDYNSFWCCQGTALETNTKLMDSIYFRDSSTLYVNLFLPSVLRWTERGVTVTQATDYPAADTTTLTIKGNSGTFAVRVRIPAWAANAQLSVNGSPAGVAAAAGTYASVNRSWKDGDTLTVKLPMKLRTVPANDDPTVAALAFGPVILSANYGNDKPSSIPTLNLASVARSSTQGLAFSGNAGGRTVALSPFFDAHGYNYNVYWKTSGSLPA